METDQLGKPQDYLSTLRPYALEPDVFLTENKQVRVPKAVRTLPRIIRKELKDRATGRIS